MSDKSQKQPHNQLSLEDALTKEHQNQGMEKVVFFMCPRVSSQFLEINAAETSWLRCCSGLLCSIALSWHCVADKEAVIDAHLVLCEASLVLPFLPPPAPSLNPGLGSEAIKQHFPEILICEEQINSLICYKAVCRNPLQVIYSFTALARNHICTNFLRHWVIWAKTSKLGAKLRLCTLY